MDGPRGCEEVGSIYGVVFEREQAVYWDEVSSLLLENNHTESAENELVLEKEC